MSDTELKLIISGDSRRLKSSLGHAQDDVRRYGNRVGLIFSQLHSKLNTGLKRMLLNPITGLASTAGVMALGKQVVDFDANLMRMAINGGIVNNQLTRMRKEIIDTALATGQSREDILSGLDAIAERTGNIKFADAIKKEMAIAATASGASMADIGALASNLNEKMQIGAEGISEAFNVLTIQGKSGAFTLRELAGLGERLFAAGGRLGMNGIEDLRRYGALVQISRMGTGSSEQATTAIERMISNIIDKQDQIKKLGFNVFADESTQKFKEIDDIVKGIIVASKGNEKILNDIFGLEGIRGVTVLTKLWRETGGFDLFDKLAASDAGRAGELMKEFERYSTTASFNLSRLAEVGKNWADISLSGPIDPLTSSLSKMMANKEQLASFEALARGLGGSLKLLAQGLTLSASGWGEILKLYESGIEKVFESRWFQSILKSIYMTNKSGVESGKIVSGFNALPMEERSRRIRDLEKNGSMSLKNENRITLNVAIDRDGRVASNTDDAATHLKTSVNRGRHRADQ